FVRRRDRQLERAGDIVTQIHPDTRTRTHFAHLVHRHREIFTPTNDTATAMRFARQQHTLIEPTPTTPTRKKERRDFAAAAPRHVRRNRKDDPIPRRRSLHLVPSTRGVRAILVHRRHLLIRPAI